MKQAIQDPSNNQNHKHKVSNYSLSSCYSSKKSNPRKNYRFLGKIVETQPISSKTTEQDLNLINYDIVGNRSRKRKKRDSIKFYGNGGGVSFSEAFSFGIFEFTLSPVKGCGLIYK